MRDSAQRHASEIALITEISQVSGAQGNARSAPLASQILPCRRRGPNHVMSLVLKIKESRLSNDGQFFLRAARCQGVENLLVLRGDEDGYIVVDLGSNGEKPQIMIVQGEQTAPWTIPEDLLHDYRNFKIGPVKLINRAGRALRAHAVAWRRWTIRNWIADFGDQFGVSSPTYVRQMCRGQVIGISGENSTRQRKPYQAKLPAPFRGVKDGGQWFVTV